MRAGVAAMVGLADYRLSKTVQERRGILPPTWEKFHTPQVVGITGGGYFQQELRSLDGEISQFAMALGSARGEVPKIPGVLGPLSTGLVKKPTTSEQDSWFQVSWLPFIENWKKFYREYAFGWKSINFPISTSRLEQLEDYRRKFIELRNTGSKIYSNSLEIQNLPTPSPPKEYPSGWDEIISTLKGAIIWIIGGFAILLILNYIIPFTASKMTK